MGIYAYCVVPSGHEIPPGLSGLCGVEVAEFSTSGVAVWVTRGPRPDGGVDAIRIHNAVVEAAVTEEVTPVPLRFGQWLDDESELQKAVAEKRRRTRNASRNSPAVSNLECD